MKRNLEMYRDDVKLQPQEQFAIYYYCHKISESPDKFKNIHNTSIYIINCIGFVKYSIVGSSTYETDLLIVVSK